MKLFLVRLLIAIAHVVIVGASVFGIVWLLLMLDSNEAFKTVVGWILVIVLGIPLSIAAIAGVIVFVNWLFVEPFRRKT